MLQLGDRHPHQPCNALVTGWGATALANHWRQSSCLSPSLSHSCLGLLLFKHRIKPSTKTSFWSWASAAAVCALQLRSSITLLDTRRARLASTMERRKNILQCESLTGTVPC